MSGAASAAAGRLAGALAASLCLHGALLASLYALPHGAGFTGETGAASGAPRPLKARLVAAAAEVLPPPPPPYVPLSVPAAPSAEAAVVATSSPAAGILPSPKYYTASELDRRPQPLDSIEPAFPALALAPVGRVTLALYIGETGEVERLDVEVDDPNGNFAESARKAFGSARYLPGMRNGIVVRSLMRVEVRFGESSPSASTQESVTREKFVPKVRVRPGR